MVKYTPQRMARINQSLRGHPSPLKVQSGLRSKTRSKRKRRNPRAKSMSGRFWLSFHKQKHSFLHAFRKRRREALEYMGSAVISASSLVSFSSNRKENQPVPTRIFIKQIGKLYKRIDRLEAQLVKEKAEREKWFEQAPMRKGSVDSHPQGAAPLHTQTASSSSAAVASSLSSTVKSKALSRGSSCDPKLIKYDKMLKMGVPKPAVMQKMEQDGIDPSELFGGAPSTKAGKRPAGLCRTTLADLKKVKLQKSTRNLGEKRKAPSSSNPRVITLDQLRTVKLRKTNSEDTRSPKTPAPQTNMPGAVISLAQLQNIKLKRTPKLSNPDKENLNSSCNSRLKEVVTFKLRRTEGVERSPGGTPTKGKVEQRSPSAARTEAEFLQLALRRKFANTALSFAQNTPDNSTSPSRWN